MFRDKYIACIKVNGQILRDDASGLVNLPFGAEYSILLKNLNSVRATVKVSVDSVDATEGMSLIVPANGSVELERFIRNGNLSAGNKFKFIERTAGIEANKGIGAEDGLVRVEFFGEAVQRIVDETVIRKHFYDEYYPVPRPYPVPYPSPWRRPYDPWWKGPTFNSSTTTTSYNSTPSASPVGRRSSGPSGSSARMGAMRSTPTRSLRPSASAGQRKIKSFTDNIVRSASLNDVGITVPGAESNQRFTQGQWFPVETAGHVIVLQLRGMLGGKLVAVPVTVKSKRKCDTCGKTNKPIDKFCVECGTALMII